MSFKDQVVIVTGGAQGIRKGTCLLFASEEAKVVCGDINTTFGEELLDEWKKQGSKGSLSFVHFDASNGEDCRKLVEFTLQQYGRIDVLFNNVGIQPEESRVPIHLLEEKTWDLLFNVNIKSFYWMSKFTIPIMMKAGKGSIINNASIQGIHSQVNVSAYAATKGAIISLTRQMACEYGGYNIRVNTVSPGSVATPLMLANTGNLDYVSGNTPLNRLGVPEDIGQMVLFLASDKASWITGQNICVDGGITIKGGWSKLPHDKF